jgi:hypothetical protein
VMRYSAISKRDDEEWAERIGKEDRQQGSEKKKK